MEVHLAGGLPALSIVGLPELAVKESKDRVRGALLSSRFQFPIGRVTINLAPADLPKEGGRFDLPIAAGVLGASGQLKCDLLGRLELRGELALSGDLRPVTGVLPAALAARDAGRALNPAARERRRGDPGERPYHPSRGTFARGLRMPQRHRLAVSVRAPAPGTVPGRVSGLGGGPGSGAGEARPGDRPQRVPTASCSSVPRGPANPCSPTGSPASCRS